jgi:hypothetical protein
MEKHRSMFLIFIVAFCLFAFLLDLTFIPVNALSTPLAFSIYCGNVGMSGYLLFRPCAWSGSRRHAVVALKG